MIILQKALFFLFAVSTSTIFAVQTAKLGKKMNRSSVHCFLLDALQELCLARVASARSGVNRQMRCHRSRVNINVPAAVTQWQCIGRWCLNVN